MKVKGWGAPFLVALILSGCGSQASTGPPAAATPDVSIYRPAAVHLPGCAGHPVARPLPTDVPAAFTLPAGSAITSIGRDSGFRVLHGIAPGTFTANWHYFRHVSSRNGFKLTYQDAEPPREAEGRFSGRGYTGGWKVVYFYGCRNAVYFDLDAKRNAGH